MIVFSSKYSGVEYDDVLGGFRSQRAENLASGRSSRLGGHEERYLRNRALFAASKAASIPESREEGENRYQFVDRKVWSA